MELKIHLRNLVGQYARLMIKADSEGLQGDELDVVFHTAINMRKGARELGVTNLQLELMLEKTVRYLGAKAQARAQTPT